VEAPVEVLEHGLAAERPEAVAHREREGVAVAGVLDGGVDVPTPFPRLTYDDAMMRYGSDKPDLRLDLELADVTESARACGFQIFEKAVAAGGIVKAMRIPDGDRLSRSALDAMTDFAKPYGAKGVAFARIGEGGVWQAPFAKAFKDEARNAINSMVGAVTGDVVLFAADMCTATPTISRPSSRRPIS